jgi:tetratricopeptide (TPR) repeat protein
MTDHDDALARYRQAVAARPDDAAAEFALGTALWPAGHRQEALEHLSRAVALDSSHIDARNNLGNALLELGRFDEAIAQYRSALALRPNAAELHYNLGNALLTCERPQEAEPCYRAALALKPDHAGAHNNLGNALRSQRRHAEAITEYRAALSLRPEFFGTLNNIGSALLALHRPDEAIPYFQDALQAHPDYAEASNNLGGAMLALDRPEQALEWFRRAVAQDSGQVQARFGEAMALLAMGNFRDGWLAYEARWLDPRFREDTPEFTDEPWLGQQSVAGRTVYVHAEQGLGDTIQFARYAPLLRRRGASVMLEVQPPLVPLMRDLADVVIAQGDAVPRYDLRCPLLSLPLAFATEPSTIPADIPYLRADAVRRAVWAGRLGPRTRPRVGIAWSGAPDHPEDAIRSIPAALLLPPLAATGVELHVIQKDIRDSDAEAVTAAGLIVHADRLTDFAETAALTSELDLVIAADTSVAHLAGALGLPTWILLQFSADFRWMRKRTDSPWYPTARLFRQTERGAWPPVIAAVAAELAGLPR